MAPPAKASRPPHDGSRSRAPLTGLSFFEGGPRFNRGWVIAGNVEGFDADQVVPILRTSREVAAASLDCFEIWNGELRFDPLPVARQCR